MKKLLQHLAASVVRGVQKYGPHEVEVLGRKYLTAKDVFNPKYWRTSEIMAKHIWVTADSDVLDMGTGCGILAVIAGHTARKVTAVDINSEAVRCARENIRRHKLEAAVQVFEGDLFAPLPSSSAFDVILFNPPYLEGKPRDDLGLALYDPDKSLINRFLEGARHYLKPGGYVQIVYSSIAEPERVLAMADELGWSCRILAEKKDLFETYVIWKLTLLKGSQKSSFQ